MGLPENCGLELHGKWPKGPLDLVSDVPGVTVGHATIHQGNVHTGVTAILPHQGDLFLEKAPAACCVINGFGKSTGLVQVQELGVIESPIMMTNTLSVGAVLDETVRYMLERNGDIGVSTGTVNCVVTECNDGSLNDIRGQHVTARHVREALESCGKIFEEGAVGSGSGMRATWSAAAAITTPARPAGTPARIPAPSSSCWPRISPSTSGSWAAWPSGP